MTLKMLCSYIILNTFQDVIINFGAKETKDISHISDIATVIISFINLCFVVYFYFKDQKIKEEEDLYRRKSFWFRNLVLDKNIDKIEEFWDKSHSIFLECSQDLKKRGTIRIKVRTVQVMKRELINKVNDYLRIIDAEAGEELDRILDDFEDYYTTTVFSMIFGSELENDSKQETIRQYEKKHEEFKSKYIKFLYKFEIDGCRYK